jgi:hypothetical protein
MNSYRGTASLLYYQDPVTGYEAYSTYPVHLPASLVLDDLGRWSVMFNFSFDHSKEGETIELGINQAYSSNPKIFIDPERWPINIGSLPFDFALTFFEEKGEWEAPWAKPRRFTLSFSSV